MTIASNKFDSAQVQSRAAATFVAAFLGLALVFISGFAGGNVLHASTHDTRHANGFPCH